MITNGSALLALAPIADMVPEKVTHKGLSHGLSEVGYDLRIKQRVIFTPPDPAAFAAIVIRSSLGYVVSEDQMNEAFFGYTEVIEPDGTVTKRVGRTALASSIERFQIPPTHWCEFRNKSTRARMFIDAALGTDGEPGWDGYLTIELVFQDADPVGIEAGTGILKAVFHEITEPHCYGGKYNHQPDRPVEAILER